MPAIDEGLDLGAGGVVAGVVDDDQLGEPRCGHGRVRLLDEAADIAGLVQRRNDDGDAHQVPLSLGMPRPLLHNGSAAMRLPVFTAASPT